MLTMLRYWASASSAFLGVLLYLQFLSLPTSAEVSIMVSPTILDLTLYVGDTSTQEISVRNSGDVSTALHLYAMDFSVDTNNNYTFSEPGHESYSCASWLAVDQSDFELGAGETRIVEVTISVPQAVEPGGHYAALFVETVPDETQPGISVAVAGRIPSLLYLTIPGVTDADISASARISSIVAPGWTDGGPVEIGAVVRNTGNVHLSIAAKAYFADFRNRQAGEIDLGQTTVLSGAERVLTGTWSNTPFIGPARITVVIGYYDEHGELVNSSAAARFWIIPWKVIIVVVGSLALVALAIWRFRRRFRFRLERKEPNA